MRIYKNFTEALNEIKRDLAEMGIEVHTQTYQDKFIGDNPEFATLELQNYIFTVTQPRAEDLNPTQPWADAEFHERISGIPGEAWKLREEIWSEFADNFGYTYPERLRGKIDAVIHRIKEDPASRQLFINVWEGEDLGKLGRIRVPCSLGYHIMVRNGAVNVTYLQRSADFATHLQNDIYLAHRLQRYIADQTGYAVGLYTHWFGSLHVYKKDVKEVF